MRGSASLWETWPPWERHSLPMRGPAFSERLGLPVSWLASLWETWPLCKRPVSLWEARGPRPAPVRGPASLWEALPPCERPCAVRGLENPKIKQTCHFVVKTIYGVFLLQKSIYAYKRGPTWMKTMFQGHLASYDSLLGDSLLMDPGLDQQQHPAVHTGRVSRGRVCSFGCRLWLLVLLTCDRWHALSLL